MLINLPSKERKGRSIRIQFESKGHMEKKSGIYFSQNKTTDAGKHPDSWS